MNARRKTGPRDPVRGALYRAEAPMIRRTDGAVANGQWRTDKRKGRGVLGRTPRCEKGGTDRLVVTSRRGRRRITEERIKKGRRKKERGRKGERGWRRVWQRPVEHLGDITSSGLPTALRRHTFVPRLASLVLRIASSAAAHPIACEKFAIVLAFFFNSLSCCNYSVYRLQLMSLRMKRFAALSCYIYIKLMHTEREKLLQ